MLLTVRAGDERARERALAALEQACRSEAPMTVAIRPFREQRRLPQNARYWSMVTEIQRQMYERGELMPVEDIHFSLKSRILGQQVNRLGVMQPRSTAALAVADFAAYCDVVQDMAARDYGIDWSRWEHA